MEVRIMPLISLLVTVIILGLVFWMLYWLLGMLPLPEPFKTVAIVILCLVGVLILLGMLFGYTPLPRIHLG
jgi:heme A synthase